MSKFNLFSGDDIHRAAVDPCAIIFPIPGLSGLASFARILNELPDLNSQMYIGVQSDCGWYWVQHMFADNSEFGNGAQFTIEPGVPKIMVNHWNMMLRRCHSTLPGAVWVRGMHNAQVIGAQIRHSPRGMGEHQSLHLQLAY